MTAIVQPAAVVSGGGAVPNARNLDGSVAGLAPGGIASLVSVTAGSHKLRGFKVHGTTDGLAWVCVDGVDLPGRIARFSRVLDAYIVLPNPEPYASASAVVELKVRNEADVSGDYEGVLFNE